VPHGLEWELERAEPPLVHPRFRALPHLGMLPDLVGWLDGA
jgi:putative hydrolase of the HAD superfamily